MTKLTRFLLSATSAFFLLACSNQNQKTMQIQSGTWKAEIFTQGKVIPFLFEVSQEADLNYTFTLLNGEERIQLTEYTLSGDSLTVPMHIFDAELKATILADGSMEGHWIKNYVEDYRVPFKAKMGPMPRFESQNKPSVDLNGKWEVNFIKPDKVTKAVGVFEQKGEVLSGTFLTATGDYRFLAGVMNGTMLQLSAFDGEHAYLFEAEMKGDSLIGGFWSGLSAYTPWKAVRNEQATLPNANELTYLKEGYDQLSFRFPGINTDMVSLSDAKYKNKVVLVQIFGTWCPNCMDETAFLSEWYRNNQQRGVEIIGLAYEKKDDLDYAKTRVNKVINRYKVKYDFAFAGISDNQKAAETLPMLSHVMSFPTTIFIDRQGKVRNIHTGFSGPGTGKYYEDFVKEFNQRMDELLAE